MDLLTRERFVPHLGSQFRVELGAGSTDIELIEVSDLRVSGSSEAFSLLFRGPGDAFLPQATYRFDHPSLGEIDLFIVPVDRDERGFCYEAVFNQVRSKEQE